MSSLSEQAGTAAACSAKQVDITVKLNSIVEWFTEFKGQMERGKMAMPEGFEAARQRADELGGMSLYLADKLSDLQVQISALL